ncbi:TFIIB-type zinc ribbon-containing protein [Sulfurisphaera javensis]|uniref:TFIIB-type zinc ribbon-containing protein n=1 Tax=Sulfurisphaera javensis TaxID=2049879 RepID=A0AAT9GRC4_9CREN
MKCPYCGSENLVWDYKNGNLVCTECGSVLDKIYSYDNYQDNNEEIILVTKSLYPDFFQKIERITKYNKVRTVKRKGLEKIIVYNGSLLRESSLNALKAIENNEKLLLLYDIIDTHPMFQSKNSKYKLAVALYLYDKREFNRLSRNLNISEKYMKKILTKIKITEKIKLQLHMRERLNT